jgi:hypothetical protein
MADSPPQAPTWRELHPGENPKIEALQLAGYGRMPAWRKLELLAGLCQTARTLVTSGLRQQYPQATPSELRHHLSARLLGPDQPPNLFSQHQDRGLVTDLTPGEVTLLVTEVLERLNIPYYLGGSLASIVYGMVRTTNDADLIADFRPEHVAPFVEPLVLDFYVEADSIYLAIQQRGSFNLVHQETMFKIAIYLPQGRPFDRSSFQRRTPQALAVNPDRQAYVASSEDTLLAKLECYRLGNQISERQWRDVLGIIKVRSNQLDLLYLRQWAAALNVADLLEGALVAANE